MERIDGAVRHTLSGAGIPDAGLLSSATRAWEDAVGAAIARTAWPTRIGRDGTLHVNTASAAWAFELGRLEEQIRSKLTAATGGDVAVPKIRFAPGPLPSPGPPEPEDDPPRHATPPTPEDLADAASIAGAVGDAALREIVRRAALASLASQRADRPV